MDLFAKGRIDKPLGKCMAPNLGGKPVIGLCLSPEEVSYLGEMSEPTIDAVVAVTPEAAAKCYLDKIPYFKIEDFCDVTILRDGDEPMLALQKSWFDAVDEFVWWHIPEFQEHGFRVAGQYFYYLKLLMDMVFHCAFGLAHLLLASKRGKLVCCVQEQSDAIEDTLFFHRPIHLEILKLLAGEYKTSLLMLPSPVRYDSSPFRVSCVSSFQPRTILKQVLPYNMLHFIAKMKRRGISAVIAPFLRKNGSSTIIVETSADADLVMDLAATKGWTVEPLDQMLKSCHREPEGRDIRSRLSDLWPQIKKQPFFKAPFRWFGVDMYGVADTRLDCWWNSVIPAMWRTLSTARAYFEERRPDAVLIAAPWRPHDWGVLQAARSLEIPTITFQHGGFIGHCEYTMLDMTDLRNADYRLVYGEGVGAYHDERARLYDEPRARTIAVGSPRLDTLRKTPCKKAKIRRALGVGPSQQLVIYVPTNYPHNWYMSRVSYSSVPYFELLTQVFDILSEAEQHKFVYKPFPQIKPDPFAEVIQKRHSNCIVTTEVPLPHLMEASNAIIVDLPSTGLLEALLTSKPILVFSWDLYLSLLPEARKLLQKRAILCEKREQFLEKLRSFVSQKTFAKLDSVDNSFLRRYGTHIDDGHSAERAMQALVRLIDSSTDGTAKTSAIECNRKASVSEERL